PSLRRELGVPDGAPLIAVLSRLSRLKGVEDFLEAAAAVSTRFKEARFLIIGGNIDPDGDAYRRELEARAAVVATRVGGSAEALEDGVDGLLVPPRDPAALSRAITWVLEHPEEAREL